MWQGIVLWHMAPQLGRQLMGDLKSQGLTWKLLHSQVWLLGWEDPARRLRWECCWAQAHVSGWLELPHNMAEEFQEGGFRKMVIRESIDATWSFITYPQKSHSVTASTFYLLKWSQLPKHKGKEHKHYHSMRGMSRNLNSVFKSTLKPILKGEPTAEQIFPISRKKGRWLLVSW